MALKKKTDVPGGGGNSANRWPWDSNCNSHASPGLCPALRTADRGLWTCRPPQSREPVPRTNLSLSTCTRTPSWLCVSGEPRLLQASSRAGSQDRLSLPLGPVSCAPPPRPLASPTRKVHGQSLCCSNTGTLERGPRVSASCSRVPVTQQESPSPSSFQSAYSFVSFSPGVTPEISPQWSFWVLVSPCASGPF